MAARISGYGPSSKEFCCGANSRAEVGKSMDKAFSEIEHELDERLSSFGWNKNVAPERSVLQALVESGLRDMGMGMTDVREASQTREQRI